MTLYQQMVLAHYQQVAQQVQQAIDQWEAENEALTVATDAMLQAGEHVETIAVFSMEFEHLMHGDD